MTLKKKDQKWWMLYQPKINVLVLRPEMSKHFNCKICKGE